MPTTVRHLRAVPSSCTHSQLVGEDHGRMWCVICGDCGVIVDYDIRVFVKS